MTNLSQRTAGDIMSVELLTAEESWSVQTLIEFLGQHKVTGVPVVSATGELRGVVSLSDINRMDSQSEESQPDGFVNQYYLASLEGYTHDDLGLRKGDRHSTCLVKDIMTPNIISVSGDAVLPEVAKLMSDKGIHRVFVTGDGGLLGVISTLDIVRQLAEV